MSECKADVRDVRLANNGTINRKKIWPGMDMLTCLVYIVTCRARQVPALAQPVALYLHLKPTLNYRISCKLRERALRKFVNLQVMSGGGSEERTESNRRGRLHCIPRAAVPVVGPY